MVETELLRNNHLVDPSLHVWGWEIPVYLFLGGLAAGLMILTALAGDRLATSERRFLRMLPFLTPVALSLGMLALFFDLEQKANVFRFYLAFRVSSPMSWGSWILLLIYPATILFGIALLSGAEWGSLTARAGRFARLLDGVRSFALENRRWLGGANVALGVALGTYTGILLGALGARPLWSSPVLGPLFLASGVSSAAALVLLASPHEGALHEWARRWDLGAIAVEAGLIGLYFIGLLTGPASGREAASEFFGGNYTAAFVALVFVPGIVLPAAMEGAPIGSRAAAARVAPVLVLLGGFALRWIIVAAGQAV